jgi:hypothetical protein
MGLPHAQSQTSPLQRGLADGGECWADAGSESPSMGLPFELLLCLIEKAIERLLLGPRV